MPSYDLTVVGGGLVGLASAWRYLEHYPGSRVAVLEKEERVAFHQSGRNSGVIHSGIYYKPGSSKAKLCRSGAQSMVEFCKREGIAYNVCGKLIVATREDELPGLEELYRRGVANGVSVSKLAAAEIAQHEPYVAGIAALLVPETGVVDYPAVAERLAALIEQRGGVVLTGRAVTAIRTGSISVLETSQGELESKYVVSCAGLQSDVVARAAGLVPECKIVPFRGEYYELRPERRDLVKALIYPVPDPAFPFLGVHFTRGVDNNVHAGPNAVLAFAREGYRKSKIVPGELLETLAYAGFLRLAARHARQGLGEMARSWSKSLFLASLQRLIPTLTAGDIVPSFSGIRAQAVYRNGKLVDDFLIQRAAGLTCVLNAPSPAATSSLEIGREIVSGIPAPVLPASVSISGKH